MSEGRTDKIQVRAGRALNDEALGSAVRFTTDRLRGRKGEATAALGNWEQWREQGQEIRAHTIENLDYYLGQFAARARNAGASVTFAADASEAVTLVKEIARACGARTVAKAKSMVSEEIHLNAALEAEGIESLETDLGEYIIQLAGEAPSHIIVPAIHKRRSEIADLFGRDLGSPIASDTPTLTAHARQVLREKFLTADVGLTGCNFAIAESGSIVLFSNEGNARMASTLPKTHIVLMGMERILPTWPDLDVMAKLLPRSATGQKLTSYMTILTGPQRPDERDGPVAMHVIILDNGRSRQLGDPEFQDVLHCIRCGACLNVCPIYRHIGGHAYASVYPGPIGAVLTPLLKPDDPVAAELPLASSLCGACTEACPVKIPLHDMLIHLRRRSVERGQVPPSERLAFRGFSWIFRRAWRYRWAGALARFVQNHTVREGRRARFLLRLLGPAAAWARTRDLPLSERPAFRDLWKAKTRDGE